MESISLLSPAKINLRLKVIGKRPDGCHDLSMIMTRISLADEILLTKTDGGIKLRCDLLDPKADLQADLQGEKNLAFRAARLFFEVSGVHGGVRIDLKKKIPIGSGLGGGSSNAATVLKGLGKIYEGGSPEVSITGPEWMERAKRLGADIPFFLTEGPQQVGGIGERCWPIALPPLSLILIYPGVSMSTRTVFERYKSRLTGGGTVDSLPPAFKGLEKLLPFLENDLEAGVTELLPVVGQIREALLNEGAMKALMTGSGSAVFGIYENRELRDKAFGRFEGSRSSQWRVFPVEGID